MLHKKKTGQAGMKRVSQSQAQKGAAAMSHAMTQRVHPSKPRKAKKI
jgi:hypothetical protein